MSLINEYPIASAIAVILFVALCFLPTFVFLLKMIYSPYQNIQGGGNDELGGSNTKDR